jgi:hypothetical protein
LNQYIWHQVAGEPTPELREQCVHQEHRAVDREHVAQQTLSRAVDEGDRVTHAWEGDER